MVVCIRRVEAGSKGGSVMRGGAGLGVDVEDARAAGGADGLHRGARRAVEVAVHLGMLQEQAVGDSPAGMSPKG
jgi:hypothetical protein